MGFFITGVGPLRVGWDSPHCGLGGTSVWNNKSCGVMVAQSIFFSTRNQMHARQALFSWLHCLRAQPSPLFSGGGDIRSHVYMCVLNVCNGAGRGSAGLQGLSVDTVANHCVDLSPSSRGWDGPSGPQQILGKWKHFRVWDRSLNFSSW